MQNGGTGGFKILFKLITELHNRPLVIIIVVVVIVVIIIIDDEQMVRISIFGKTSTLRPQNKPINLYFGFVSLFNVVIFRHFRNSCNARKVTMTRSTMYAYELNWWFPFKWIFLLCSLTLFFSLCLSVWLDFRLKIFSHLHAKNVWEY